MNAPASVVQLPHGRVPPHNLDAERSLIGGVMLEAHKFLDVQGLVAASDFYRGGHAVIWDAICELGKTGEPVDRVAVKELLDRTGRMKDAGGEEYVDKLDAYTPIAANLAHYAQIIADKSLARRAIEAAHAIAQLGYEQHGEVREFIDEAEAKFFALRRNVAGKGFTKAYDLIAPTFKEIEARSQHDNALTGAPSGLDELDAMTNGFQVGHLIILAARPSMGKSSLSRDVVRATCKAGGGVALFSLEMPNSEIVQAMLAAEGCVDLNHIRTGQLTGMEWERLSRASEHIAKWELHLDDTARTLSEIRAGSRRLQAKLEAAGGEQLRLIVIDYLQLMRGSGEEDSREQVIASISRELKALAKELKLPVLALSQLNRELEKRPNKRPQMSDLRESGSLEQDADEILFIYRGVVYRTDDMGPGEADIMVAKQRMGPLGDVRVAFQKEFSKFNNLAAHAAEAKQMRLDQPPPHSDEDARYP